MWLAPLWAALTLWAAPASAKGRPRLIVLDLPADKAFEPNVLKVTNSILAKDLRDQGFDVITASDIGAALGVERQKQLLGCTESSCMAEIGGALGAEYIVHGELASLETATALTLTLTDNRGRAINQVGGVLKDKTAQSLLTAVEQDVPQLVKPLKDSGKLPGGAAPAAALVATPAAQPAEGGSRLPSYVLLGAGAALLVGSGVAGALASGNNSKLQDAVHGRRDDLAPADIESLRGTVRTQAWASTGLLAAGVVAAGAGAVLFLLGGSSEPAHASLSSAGGPALAWEF